jgi:hypothetical protein
MLATVQFLVPVAHAYPVAIASKTTETGAPFGVSSTDGAYGLGGMGFRRVRYADDNVADLCARVGAMSRSVNITLENSDIAGTKSSRGLLRSSRILFR